MNSLSDMAYHQLENLVILLGAGIIGFIAGYLLFKATKLALKSIPDASTHLINKKFRFAFIFMTMIIALNVSLSFADISPLTAYYLHKVFYIFLIFSFALLLIKVTEFIKGLLYNRFDINVQDNLDERKARTQIDFLQKLSSVVIIFIAFAVVLMSFERVRELGTSILASAGIAGVIVGFAAQKSLSNLLAGFQIAFTQPIRLEDVVVVENEWGRIEEITLTYVVVKIWDMRRLVLPISYFIERPFQNWTRVSADIMGTVFLYTDYTIPIDELRKELTRILKNEGKALWDEKVGGVQITNANDKGIEVRCLMSSANASHNWDLRCLVREKMIGFIHRNYPEALPKVRLEQQVEA